MCVWEREKGRSIKKQTKYLKVFLDRENVRCVTAVYVCGLVVTHIGVHESIKERERNVFGKLVCLSRLGVSLRKTQEVVLDISFCQLFLNEEFSAVPEMWHFCVAPVGNLLKTTVYSSLSRSRSCLFCLANSFTHVQNESKKTHITSLQKIFLVCLSVIEFTITVFHGKWSKYLIHFSFFLNNLFCYL